MNINTKKESLEDSFNSLVSYVFKGKNINKELDEKIKEFKILIGKFKQSREKSKNTRITRFPVKNETGYLKRLKLIFLKQSFKKLMLNIDKIKKKPPGTDEKIKSFKKIFQKNVDLEDKRLQKEKKEYEEKQSDGILAKEKEQLDEDSIMDDLNFTLDSSFEDNDSSNYSPNYFSNCSPNYSF